jgi:hypothetical protein
MGPDFRYDFSAEHPHWHVPYRALVPRNIKNVLATGRCISADPIANDLLAPIQYCFATGQAAGTAAAIAVKDNVTAAYLDVRKLQKRLIEQNVPLPDEITLKMSFNMPTTGGGAGGGPGGGGMPPMPDLVLKKVE